MVFPLGLFVGQLLPVLTVGLLRSFFFSSVPLVVLSRYSKWLCWIYTWAVNRSMISPHSLLQTCKSKGTSLWKIRASFPRSEKVCVRYHSYVKSVAIFWTKRPFQCLFLFPFQEPGVLPVQGTLRREEPHTWGCRVRFLGPPLSAVSEAE